MRTTPRPIAPTDLHRAAGGKTLEGDGAANHLRSFDEDDQVFGLGGDDSISSGDGADLVWGGQGHDTLDGGSGDDTLHGQDGHDLLRGGDGQDWLWAGAGDDTFDGRTGGDALTMVGVTWQQVVAGLELLTPGVNVQIGQGGFITFTNSAGQPVGVSGTVTLGGEIRRRNRELDPHERRKPARRSEGEAA